MALWTPTEITTALWLDADDSDTITLDGSDNVEQWDDKSGNNKDAVQTSSGYRPAVETDSLNNLDTVKFSSSYLFVSSIGLEQPTTYFAVVKTNDLNEERQYVMDGFDDAFDRNLLALNRSDKIDIWSGSWISSGKDIDLDWHFYSCTFNGATSNIYVDAVLENTGDAGTYDSDSLIIGANYLVNLDFLSGEIAEFIVVDDTVSTSDRQRIEGYLAHKWGLEDNLPVGHPYKSSPPSTTTPAPTTTTTAPTTTTTTQAPTTTTTTGS